ncbi:hypothetical protein C7121_01620 [Paenibacillus glucanolyticus]|jgi:hypothetical protein|nr:hypothetical protein A3958_13885 [Paenibacillus glucanolyticus]AVV54932.1 hypothetical protein C7121_01620 [Paenibacillus glucanolyticus]ETT36444.1 hypothetical protein C169_14469 [Paenibacillus sp. FSL R5-808]OMF70932.1 hypothetical protein BK142_22765 [Paenibacillus glucanolyticus]
MREEDFHIGGFLSFHAHRNRAGCKRTDVAFFEFHGMMYLKNLKLKIYKQDIRADFDGIADCFLI